MSPGLSGRRKLSVRRTTTPLGVGIKQTKTKIIYNSATTATLAFDTTPAPGNLLLAGLVTDKDSGTISLSSGSVSNGWQLLPSYVNLSVSGAVAYKLSASGSTTADSVTFQWPTSRGANVVLHETNLSNAAFVSSAVVPNPVSDATVSSYSGDLGAASAEGVAFTFTGIDTAAASSPSSAWKFDTEPSFSNGYSAVVRQFGDTSTGSSNGGAAIASAKKDLVDGTTSGTTVSWTGDVDQAWLIMARFNGTGGGAIAPTPVLVNRVVGVDGRVKVRVADSTSVRLKIGTDIAVTSGVVFTSAVAPNAQGDATLSTAGLGLVAGGTYYYRVEMNGHLDTAASVGRFKIAPTGQANFAFNFSSCCNSSDSVAMAAIAARNDDMFLNLGDFWYGDGTGVNVDNYRNRITAKQNATNHAAVFHKTPSTILPSDHDYGMNNNSFGDKDPTAQSLYNQVYRELMPTKPVPATLGVYHSWAWGRVRFVALDCRTFMDNPLNTDDANKTKLGTAQKQWLKDLFTNSAEKVFVLLSDVPWVAPKASDDDWGGYTTERAEIFNHAAAAGKQFLVLGGDMHAVSYDTGTAGSGNITNFQAAPLAGSVSHKAGPWDAIYPTTTGSTVQQYGRVVVTDNGTSISFAFTGYSADDTARISNTKTFTL